MIIINFIDILFVLLHKTKYYSKTEKIYTQRLKTLNWLLFLKMKIFNAIFVIF